MNLVAVDWGTSFLRVARMDSLGRVLQERAAPRGILTVPPGGFPAVLQDTCGDWLRERDVLCLVSGMAGSRQGWREAPYCPCPCGFADLANALTWIEPGRIALVPGLSCESGEVPDVIRGEEVQVFGAVDLLKLPDGMFVLPGTHSKWVRVEAGRVQSFATFMSGEFYALLRQHSILSRTLPAEEPALDTDAFVRGLQYAQESRSLLRSAFSARTLSLFDRMPADALASYLSGLVIGEELRAHGEVEQSVVLIGQEALTARYALALRSLGTDSRRLGPEATWRGLWALARNLQHA